MSELGIDEFQKIITKLLEDNGYNVVLSNPDDEETFPCVVVSNPMKSIRKTENNIPIFTRFAINIEWWTNSKYESMRMYELTNRLLRNYNVAQIGNPTELYDDLTKKQRYGGKYEVNYNGLTNSFEKII